MYYRQTRQCELTRREMELARKGFRGKLVRQRFSPSFVINNSDELLAKAHGDFARALSRGVEIEDPVAFTVHCAWRHTQNLLRSEERTPAAVSTEKAAELVDGELSPDELVLAEDRVRKVHRAVSKLNENQRKVIALVFFEDMSWREAAKHLGWTPSKVQHHYEKAMEHLQRFLAVKSSDELAIDIGMAAWLSCAGASAHGLPAGFEVMLEKAGKEATGLWHKANEVARRLVPGGGGGGEQIGVIASGGGGRSLGACAGVIVTCIVGAGDVAGPGLVQGVGHSGSDHKPHRASPRSAGPNDAASAVRTNRSQRSAAVPTNPTPAQPAKRSSGSSQAKAATSASSPHAEATRVREQTSGIARAGAESSESASAPSASSSSGSGASEPEAVTVTSAPSPAPSPQEEASAQKQFGAFK